LLSIWLPWSPVFISPWLLIVGSVWLCPMAQRLRLPVAYPVWWPPVSGSADPGPLESAASGIG
jgi:hypothetical protein